jgi:alanyl-tRNA synthetase
MNHKLFYKDPYINSFETNAVKQEEDANGTYIVLAETAFYPTGGGQPNDLGSLNEINVVNVEEVNGEIRHYVEKALSHIDEKVVGVIDWKRRFDHMQQHAGQHILSAVFEQLYEVETIGFHLGEERVTIDLALSEITEEIVRNAERHANQIITDNRTIHPKWVEFNELANYPLRNMPTVQQNIRLVIIDDFDYNGCGGTHPKHTGEIGAINILYWERQRKNIRLHFVCGNRVIDQLTRKQKVINDLTRVLNNPEEELFSEVNRLLETIKVLDKTLLESNEKLLHYEARELLIKHEIQDDIVIIIAAFSERPVQELQNLARIITEQEDRSIIFFLASGGNDYKIVCARGKIPKVNMKIIAQKSLLLINGKGGGNEAFAQGGGAAILNEVEFILEVTDIIGQQVFESRSF